MEVCRRIGYNKMDTYTVGVWIKYSYFDKISRQHKLDTSIAMDSEIYDNGIKVFNELWNKEDGIRAICIFVSGLSDKERRQLSIFDIDSNDDKDKVQDLVDEIRRKYGKDSIGFGRTEKKEDDVNER